MTMNDRRGDATSGRGGAPSRSHAPPLELWGGHECTVNRVGDRWFDQTVRTGHEHRLDDLDRFSSLGVTTLRYPVLWERVSPAAPEVRDWSWTDARLGRMRELGIAPIAGLVHHGAGPAYTHLLDGGFAPGLASHARAVAERYPWIDSYTPVNEPLTTARFSGQYGHWHPHGRDETAFLHALVNEIEATRAAMKAIREVNPRARLVQTDDIGHAFATDPLLHQSAYENERRWITFDLLCGRVTPDHVMWRFFHANGLADRVAGLVDDPCPPDVMGLNYYLSSERFLDHRLDLYPAHLHGGNGRDRYVDIEAVRAVLPGVMGLERLLLLAHERYGLPLAVTEAHNGCTRDEQMRWLFEQWEACEAARAQGVDVRALTAWSLLGAVDWNSLLTRDAGHYEPGVWDVRGDGPPRETALADVCRRLSGGVADARPPAAEGPGWWSRDIRLCHPPTWAGQTLAPRGASSPPAAPRRPVLVLGGDGVAGRALLRALDHRGHAWRVADANLLSPRRAEGLESALDAVNPWAVIHAVEPGDPDAAERAAGAAMDQLGYAMERLAGACALRATPLLAFSSELVFDGRKPTAYRESDAPAPLGALGRAQLTAEEAVRAHGGLVVRTGPLFDALEGESFAREAILAMSQGRRFDAADDRRVSPSYAPDLADAALDLLMDGEEGVVHLANAGALTPADFARVLARALDLDPDLVVGGSAVAGSGVAPRPRQGALESRLGTLLPPLEGAIARYAAAVRPVLAVTPIHAPAHRARPRPSPRDEPRSFASA